MQRLMVYVLLIYLIVFLIGMNFVLKAITFGLLGSELAIVALVVLLPALFLLIYFFRANIGSLEDYEKALHYLIYISLAVSVAFTVVIIIPVIYS